jgi:hypothetical protein
MPLIPNRFLIRMAHPCPYIAGIPEDDEELFSLPVSCRLANFGALDDRPEFAEVRMAWNEEGLAFQVVVKGKDQPCAGDLTRPKQSDGATLWIDTRDSRSSHRASRYCHQFHFLAAGAGPERNEAGVLQERIPRALQDAPLAPACAIPFRCRQRAGGYHLTAFLPSLALHGFDPEQNPRLGVFYAVRDMELGEQTLTISAEFPYAEDPTLWEVLELVGSA